ncbi:MAG: conjugal transfer protein TraX [Clostridia bacterium]|nr:conjugal transfer protein TraX [Clostridia bacterium]
MVNIKRLDSNMLKLIAIIAMTVDHIAWAVFPGYSTNIVPVVLHIIGRITCPIMCYFIAEGYHYTRNINKYTTRLFVFAIISHFAYVAASNSFVDWKSFIPFYYGDIFNQTSVIWALAWGLVILRVVNSNKIKNNIFKIVLVLLICVISFPSDWSCIASLCVLAIGTNRDNFKKQMLWMIFYVFIYATVYFFALNKVYGIIQMGIVLAIPLLMMYNGNRGKNQKLNSIMKWFFYVYYPLHLFLISMF